MNDVSLEITTQRIGRQIFAQAEAAGASVLSMEYWQGAAMGWLTQREDLKIRAFRFIEVLPALADEDAIAAHLMEYLGGGEAGTAQLHLPPPLELALSFRRPNSAYARALAALSKYGCLRFATRFICGSTLHEATAAVQRMRRQGMTFTLDVLGEAVIADRVARAHQHRYIELIQELAAAAKNWPDQPLIDAAPWGPLPKVNVSIKLSAIVPKFDPIDPAAARRIVAERLSPVLSIAREHGVFINLDMEQYAVKDLTLAIFRDMLDQPEFRDWPDCGIVIQAYLRDAEDDLRELVAWARHRGTPITVRLVKGAYWDYETIQSVLNGWPIPVYTRKPESDACFERCARIMLENVDILRPAFASHNVRSIAAAMAMERAFGLPARTVEFQMLAGMGDQLKRALVNMGQRLRVYSPYGDWMPGMAYLIRRLIENTSNESFLLQSFGRQQSSSSGNSLSSCHAARSEASQRFPHESGHTRGTGEILRFAQNDADCVQNDAACIQDDTACVENDARYVRNVDPIGRLLANPAMQIGRDGLAMYRPIRQDPDEDDEMPRFENESEVNFSSTEEREEMEGALRTVRGQFGRECPAIIGGERVFGGRWIQSLNPSRPDEIVGRAAVCDVALVDRAVEAARRGAVVWGKRTAEERASVLEKAATLLQQRRFEAAAWQIYEVGKTWREAHGDVVEAIDYLRFYAHEAIRLERRGRRRDLPGESNEYVYRPRGVVVVISPFSFPMALMGGMTAAALAAGNTVVVKPARTASVCALFFVECLLDAGLPPGALNLTPGPGEVTGDYLSGHSGVDMVAFTGSTAVGERLIEKTGHLRQGPHGHIHVLAEMGGKNAIIVDDDADLDEAVQGVIASAFGFSGQKCTSCSRVIVVTGVYETFVEKLVEAASGIQPAAADLPSTTVGPLVDADAVRRVREYVAIGTEDAVCVLGSAISRSKDRDDAGGYFQPPAIFADVPPESRLATDEILGPVLALMRADDFAHAITLANATRYGLVGGVYSRRPSHIEAAKRGLAVGNLYINRKITASRVDRQPFGGWRESGLGAKAGGPDYLQQFCVAQTIAENTMRHGFAPVAKPVSGAAANK